MLMISWFMLHLWWVVFSSICYTTRSFLWEGYLIVFGPYVDALMISHVLMYVWRFFISWYNRCFLQFNDCLEFMDLKISVRGTELDFLLIYSCASCVYSRIDICFLMYVFIRYNALNQSLCSFVECHSWL